MKKLTEGNIYKTFFLFALPLVFSGLLTQIYNLINTIIAGRFLGEAGLAAIGATSPYITFVSSFFIGYEAAFAIYIARLFGNGKHQKMCRGVSVHLVIDASVALLITLFTLIFRNQILDLLNVEDAIRKETLSYLMIYISGMVLITMNHNATVLLATLGDTSFSFFMSLISTVINIAGNLLSVTVFHLGVAGLAATSILAAGIGGSGNLIRVLTDLRKLPPDEARLPFSLTETREALSYTIPTVLQQNAIYFVGLLLAPMLNATGSTVIASYVVTSKILDIFNNLSSSSSRTVSNYASQVLGEQHEQAHKLKMLKRGLWVGFLQNVLFIVVFLIPCLLVPSFIANIFFTDGSAPESVDLTVLFIRVFLPGILIYTFDGLFHAFFRGLKTMKLLIGTTLFSSVSRILISLPLTAKFGINGFYAGMILAWAAEAVILLIIYRTGVWIPREIRKKTVFLSENF